MRTPLDELKGKDFDVAIIGGGINGAAAAQHIAAQGNDVLLVEKEDFGSGSTGRSSRLLHCGLRYLAPGRSVWTFVRHPRLFADALKMARQAMQARAEFVASSPERVRQMAFAFPIYRDGPYSGWQVDLAFLVLKLIGPRNPPLDYRRIPASRIQGLPLARELRNLDQLDSVAVYREYQFDWPERICVDCVLDAERLGAVVRNYTSARFTSMDENGRWSLNLRDTRTGDTADIRASLVLNMAGIWIDDVNATYDARAGRRVTGTKGSHILVKLPSGYSGLGLATINSKNEPFYCIPWYDLHYFGPTETPYEGDRDDIHVTEDEQLWLLQEANRLLPGVSLSSADVRLTWAGVRPLTYDKAVPSGNRSRHLHDMGGEGMPNVLALTAGPVMSHRSTGRLLAREVAKRVKPGRAGQSPRYSSGRSRDEDNPPFPAAQDPAIRASDIRDAVREEHALTLGDVLFRRLGLCWRRAFSRKEIERAAAILAAERHLSADETRREIDLFYAEWQGLYGPRSLKPDASRDPRSRPNR